MTIGICNRLEAGNCFDGRGSRRSGGLIVSLRSKSFNEGWRSFQNIPQPRRPVDDDFRSSWAILCVERWPHCPIGPFTEFGSAANNGFQSPCCRKRAGLRRFWRIDRALENLAANGKALALDTTQISERRES